MNVVDLSNITYDGIKTELVNFIKQNSTFTDWNFEGSNLSFLTSMMAYAAYYSNVYNAFVLNEAFLDTAQLRSNVVSHAKQQGYIPRSSKAAKMEVKIDFDTAAMAIDGVPIPDYVTINKGQLFSVRIGEILFIFNTNRNYIIYKNGTSLCYPSVELLEGIKFEINTFYKFNETVELPAGTDIDTLEVYINNEKWEYTKTAVNVKRNSKVYYVYENSNGLFEVFFGDNVNSLKPFPKDKITITGLQTSEDAANAANADVTIEYTDQILINNIDYSKYLRLTVLTKPFGGSKKEDTESVRQNAIGRVITQDRAVTILDYVKILESVFYELVDKASVWDYYELKETGEAVLTDLGKVYISIKPQDFRNKPVLTPYEIDLIGNELHKNYIVPGIILDFVEPTYIYIKQNIDVYYNEINLNLTLNELQSLIKTNVSNKYSELAKFNTYLPLSLIQSEIDKTDSGIVSSIVKPRFFIKINHEQGITLDYSKRLFNSLVPGSISSTFLNITDDGAGNITSDLGNIGTVDYTNGTISFTIPAASITVDGSFDLNFETLDNQLKVKRDLIYIDDVNGYTFNMIKV